MPSREERRYEIPTLEVTQKNLAPAIWGKAFSEALGNPQAALALYIKLRVQQLEREYQESLFFSNCPACKKTVKPRKNENDFLLALLGNPRFTFTCPECKGVVPPPVKF